MTVSAPRRKGRELVVRAIYQAEVCGDPVERVWGEIDERTKLPSEALEYADELCQTIEENARELDTLLRPHLENWSFERLGVMDRGVLKAGAAELAYMKGTPARVILDEAVEIATTFSGPDSGRFVNGVLDRLARQLRPGELEGSELDRSGS